LNTAPSGVAAAVLAAAARAVAAVALEGRSSEHAFDDSGAGAGAAPRAAVRAVTLGTLRWYLQLEPIVVQLLAGKALAPVLRTLLAAALHQLQHSRNPIETTVSSAVDAARVLGQPRAAGMTNALLRRYLRERESILATVMKSAEAASAHPGWLLAALRSCWPGQWQQIVDANNAHPPMTLRLDLARSSREAYVERLLQQGAGASAVSWLPTALVLDSPLPVARLPGFEEGLVSVQDAGAQLAAALLAPRPGERVLDACAAPGGKTGALLESANGSLELTALDLNESRLELIAQNLARLRRSAQLVAADLRAPLDWWDGTAFDRILLDAPCSSTGVIRRHPDIKLLRRSGDIAAFADTQQRLLKRCLGMLRPGGRLLYSTCSLLPAENEQIVAAALAENPAAREVAFEPTGSWAAQWLVRPLGVQLLPGAQAQTDGFYYACLTVT
jgi:16S rRNA (cytosine967-C5)-methyltransferase